MGLVPCCLPDNSCLLLEPSACLSQGGRVRGIDGSTCASISCTSLLGACCREVGSCLNNLTQAQCESLSGGPGQFFQGVDCGNTDCSHAATLYVCCKDGVCSLLRDVVCRLGGGETFLNETSCEGFQCPPPAQKSACCLGDGTCLGNLTLIQCDQRAGRFILGPGRSSVTCGVHTCERLEPGDGACCAAGICSIKNYDECRLVGGLFVQNTTCLQIDCALSNMPGACCKLDGDCFQAESRRVCDTFHGLFYPNGRCGIEANCSFRGCCRDGECYLTTPQTCENQGGRVWHNWLCVGPGGVPIECGKSACCFEDDRICQNLTGLDCLNQGGEPQSEFTQCSFPMVHCDVPRGAACCFPEGSCQTLTEDRCNALGGFWRRDGICPEYGTDDPSPCIKTACCLPGGTCENTTRQGCNARSGYWYNGKTCADAECGEGDVPRYFDPIGTVAPSGLVWDLDLCQWALFEPVLVLADDNYARLESLHPMRAVEPDWGREHDTIYPGEPCGYHWGDMGIDSEGLAEPRFCSKPYYGDQNFDQTTVMKAYIKRLAGIPDDMEPSTIDENQDDGFTAFGGMYHTPYWIEASFNSALRICAGVIE